MLENFYSGLSSEQIVITEFLHSLFTENYGLVVSIKYGIPFYTLRSWVCYINPLKNNKIELAFTRGVELKEHSDILSFKGRKQVGGFEIFEINKSQIELIELVLQDAIILDEEVPYKSKRKKN